MALEAPLAAQDVRKEPLVRAARDSVDRRVRAHHALDLRVRDERLERRQVVLVEIAVVEIDVELVAQVLWPGVDGVVLRARGGLEVLRIVALDAPDERRAHHAGEIRVLAERLLSAAPQGIAEHVDVRAPKRKALVNLPRALCAEEVVLGARLGRDDVRHLLLELRVERRRRADRLREHRRETRAGDAVQRLVPPVVGRDPEPVYGLRLHHQFGDALVSGQLLYKRLGLCARLGAAGGGGDGLRSGDSKDCCGQNNLLFHIYFL